MEPKDYLKMSYTFVLRPDTPSGFSAEVLEFPGCFAEGETVIETWERLQAAADGWLSAMLGMGRKIPAPGFYGDLECAYCGSLNIERRKEKETFLYGAKDSTLGQREVVAVVTVSSCLDCDQEWTDGDQEQVRSDAIVNTLAKELEQLKQRVIMQTNCVCGDLKCDECPR